MSKSHPLLLPSAIVGLCALLMSGVVSAAPPAVACRVLAASGAAFARDAQGHERPLHRRDRVYVGETLVTGSGGHIQVRFSDGGLVALQPASSLKVNSYHYDGAQDGTESEVLHLVKGGMRTISGAIGHKHPDSYGVKAGTVATIGIRGTHYVLQLCNGGCGKGVKGLYGGVLHGQIVVKNASGTTAFSTDQYFRVANAHVPPQTLLAPPAFLSRQSVPHKKQEKKGGNEKASGGKGTAKKKEEGGGSSAKQKSKSAGQEGKDKGSSNDGEKSSPSGGTGGTSSSSASGSSGGSTTQSSSTGSSGETSTASSTDETQTTTTSTTTSSSSTSTDTLETSGGTTLATTRDTTSDSATTDTTTTLLDPATTASTTQTTSNTGSNTVSLITNAVAAPSSGGFGVAFLKKESGGYVDAASGMITGLGGTNTLLLNTVNGVGNVPVYGQVTDPNTSQPDACNPCSFSVGSGTLSHVGGVGGTIPVNWGRWDSGYVVTENGVVDSTTGGFDYIYSPAMTTPTQLSAMTGSFTYALPLSGGHGPGLTDESGGTGQLTSMTVGVDFSTQNFTSANLATNTFSDGRQFSMSMASGAVTDFGSVVNNQKGLQLSGSCNGGSCGGSTAMDGNLAIGFVGPNAERMITTVGLRNQCGSPGCNSTIGASGAAMLNR